MYYARVGMHVHVHDLPKWTYLNADDILLVAIMALAKPSNQYRRLVSA